MKKKVETKKAPVKKQKLDDLAQMVDRYYLAREERLAKQREVDAMEKAERDLKAHIIHLLEESLVKTVGGSVATVSLVVKTEPQVTDWTAFYEHIRSTGQFELLYRRVNNAAVKERWDDNEEVPGVGTFPVATLSMSAVK